MIPQSSDRLHSIIDSISEMNPSIERARNKNGTMSVEGKPKNLENGNEIKNVSAKVNSLLKLIKYLNPKNYQKTKSEKDFDETIAAELIKGMKIIKGALHDGSSAFYEPVFASKVASALDNLKKEMEDLQVNNYLKEGFKRECNLCMDFVNNLKKTIELEKIWIEQDKSFDDFIQSKILPIKTKKEIGEMTKILDGAFLVEKKNLYIAKDAFMNRSSEGLYKSLEKIFKDHPEIKNVMISGESWPIPKKYLEECIKEYQNAADKKSCMKPSDFLKASNINTPPLKEYQKRMLLDESKFFKNMVSSNFIESSPNYAINLDEKPEMIELLKTALDILFMDNGSALINKDNIIPLLLHISQFYEMDRLVAMCAKVLDRIMKEMVGSLDPLDYPSILKDINALEQIFPKHRIKEYYKQYLKNVRKLLDINCEVFKDKYIFEEDLNLPTKTKIDFTLPNPELESILEMIAQFPLKELILVGANETHLQFLKKFHNLEKLTLDHIDFPAEQLDILKNLPSYCELEIVNSPLSKDHLTHLSSLDNLKILTLDASRLSANELEYLPLGLEKLKLISYNEKFLSLKHLEKLKVLIAEKNSSERLNLSSSLEELDLNTCPKIGNEALKDIGSTLVKLKKLDISHSTITDEGMKYINQLPLNELQANYCPKITRQGLLNIANMTSLLKLRLDQTQVESTDWSELIDSNKPLSLSLPPEEKKYHSRPKFDPRDMWEEISRNGY